MSEYNIDGLDKLETQSSNSSQGKPKIALAALAGFGTSVVVAIILAIIAMISESEFMFLLIIGAVIVGVVIHQFVPNRSIGGAILGAILCPATYFMYNLIMLLFGYYYEEDGDTWFWIMLVGSMIYGAYIGYNTGEE